MTSGTSGTRPAMALVLASVLALVLGACAEEQASTGGGGTLSITSPADGASVQGPVRLVLLMPGVEIGAPEDGLMHFHVHIDGSNEFKVVSSTTAEVPVPAGQHTLEVVLAQPNHDETDTTATISVTVTGGSPAQGGGGYGGGDRYGVGG